MPEVSTILSLRLKDPNVEVRRIVAWGLLRANSRMIAKMPSLKKEKDVQVRIYAALAFMRLGLRQKEALTTLQAIFADPKTDKVRNLSPDNYRSLRDGLICALAKMEKKAALPLLQSGLKMKGKGVRTIRICAAWGLARLGVSLPAALEVLVQGLFDFSEFGYNSGLSLKALRQLGAKASLAHPTLRRIHRVGRVGNDGRRLIEKLLPELKRKSKKKPQPRPR